jgi:hypothetical protein
MPKEDDIKRSNVIEMPNRKTQPQPWAVRRPLPYVPIGGVSPPCELKRQTRAFRMLGARRFSPADARVPRAVRSSSHT